MARVEFEENESKNLDEQKNLHFEENCNAVKYELPSIAVITFPGIVIHELTHYFALLVTGAKVVSYKLWSDKYAYVSFKPNTRFSFVFTAGAPFLVGTILAIAFFDQFFNSLATREVLLSAFWFWLGASTSIHAVPSIPDLKLAQTGLKESWKGKTLADQITMLIFYVPVAYPLLWFLEIREKIFKNRNGNYAWTILLLLFTAGIQNAI